MVSVQTWLGGVAGLATAGLWAGSATAWGFAGRRIHSLSVAAIRILLAGIILSGVHWIVFGEPWPTNVDLEPLLLLAGSGLIGMALGDICYFRGISLIGPRLATLIFSLCPIATVVIAWFTRDEHLTLRQIAGIFLNVAGVAWAVSEPRGRKAWREGHGHFREGVIYMLIATVIIAVGYVFTKAGMDGGERLFTQGPPLPRTDAFQGTLIRVSAGFVATWIFLPLAGRFRSTLAALKDRRAMLFTVVGTVVGPVVGVWTSLIALQNAPSGIASALIGTSPIFMIPLSSIAFGEKHTVRSLAGTVVAIAGVFLLLL